MAILFLGEMRIEITEEDANAIAQRLATLDRSQPFVYDLTGADGDRRVGRIPVNVPVLVRFNATFASVDAAADALLPEYLRQNVAEQGDALGVDPD